MKEFTKRILGAQGVGWGSDRTTNQSDGPEKGGCLVVV